MYRFFVSAGGVFFPGFDFLSHSVSAAQYQEKEPGVSLSSMLTAVEAELS
jgi:hypothetical protein